MWTHSILPILVKASAMANPFQREVKEPSLSDEDGTHVTVEEGTNKGHL